MVNVLTSILTEEPPGFIGDRQPLGAKALRLQTAVDLAFLIGLFWIARYWHSARFGLYEDDLTLIPDAFARSFSSLLDFIGNYIATFSGQGRPFSHSFIYLFSWLGWQLDGLRGAYLIGYVLAVLNIMLFFLLVRRASDRALALMAGIGYVLYSADTTQAFLTISFGVQPSITFVLLAAHKYLSGRRLLAYLLAFFPLFIYETPYLLFLAAPLFKQRWDRPLLRELLWHTTILGLMLAGVFLFRYLLGEGRVGNLSPTQVFTVPLLHMLQGPVVSLGTFGLRPLQALQGINLDIAAATVVGFAVFLFMFSRLRVGPPVAMSQLWKIIRSPEARRESPEVLRMLARLAVIGLTLLILAYPLTFTVRAYAISGRDTRVHTAGVAGAAILVACLVYLLLLLAQNRWRLWANVALAAYFALLLGYGFVVQRDYVLAWQYQREFWTELLPLIPDAAPGTVVLVEPSGLKDTRQIGANYWNMARVLNQLYVFPPSDDPPPHVNRLNPGWERDLGSSDGLLALNERTGWTINDVYGSYPSTSVIFIETTGGELARRSAPLILDGQEFPLKPVGPAFLPELQSTLLHEMLIASSSQGK
jgi:hypothetical protein